MNGIQKKIVSVFLSVCFLFLDTAALAAQIVVSNTYKTETTVTPDNSIYKIQTKTTTGSGTIGINSFDKFNVYSGDTVNFDLIGSQNKLVNLIYDNSPSQINGIINSYKNGVIGGDMLFANSNGFLIGSGGVFNVGSLTLMTPTQDSMKSLFNGGIFSGGELNHDKFSSLISFSMNGNDYLVNGAQENKIAINPSGIITIDGVINSGGGIDLIAGNKIDINSTAQLNANQKFTISGDTVTHSDKVNPDITSIVNNKRTMAMSDGKGIVIVATNSGANKDYMSAIVNLDGKINANGNDVVVASEVHKASNSGTDGAYVYAKSAADISGRDVTLKAQSKITDFDQNLLNLDDDYGAKVPIVGDIADALGDVANYIAGYVVHDAKINSKVEVQSGAKIDASRNLNINSVVDADLKASTTSIGLALNVVDLSSNSESIVKSGSILKSKNLTVSADNDVNLTVETKVTNLSDNYINNNVGNGVVTVAIEKIKTNAEIEKNANLTGVTNNLTVNAATSNTYKEVSKNSALPLVDKSHGELGIGISVNYIDTQNTATLNSNASVSGDVNVAADISQQINKQVNISATGASGLGEKIGKGILSGVLKSDLFKPALAKATTKSNTNISNTEIAGAVGVSLVNASSVAKIGDAAENIKPTIKAKNVSVSSTMYDAKSNLDVEAMSEKEAKTIAGAIGVNYKNISSDSTVNANITVDNSYIKNSSDFGERLSSKDVLTPSYTKYYAWKVNFEGKEMTLYTTSASPSEGDVLYTNISKTDAFVPSNFNYYVSSLDSANNKISLNRAALNVFADTKITHPLSYIDIIKSISSSTPDFFSNATWSEAWDNVKDKWNSADSADPTTYLNYLTALSGLSSLTDTQFIDDISNTISLASNTNNFGIYDFFNTYVQAASNSVSDTLDSGTINNQKALSGAIGVSAFTQSANAAIKDGSVITMNTSKDAGSVNVLANSTSEVWTAATLLNPLNYKNFAIGSTSGGLGVGGTVAVGYSDSSATATIGNVSILKGSSFNGASDVKVISKTDGSFLNLSAGSSTGDKTGVSGSINIGYVNGLTKAGIEKDAVIYSSDKVLVKALKDILNMNIFFAFAKASNKDDSNSTAVGFGISGLIVQDVVDAYINGTITTSDVELLAKYDQTAVNAGLNMAVQTQGKATSQTDSNQAFQKSVDEHSETDLGFIGALLSQDWDAQTLNSVWDAQNAQVAESGASSSLNSAKDATSKLSSSKSGAGGITVSWLDSDVKSHIGGTINAVNDVSVEAKNNVQLYDTYVALATGGKTGAGASVMLDVLQNNVSAYIDKNATVNAGKNLSILADSDYKLIAASAGVASGKDSTGAGNLAVTVQLNDIQAYIDEGVKVNETQNAAQTVSVKADNKTSTVKVAGAVAVQKGTPTQATQNAVGGTINANIVKNKVKAYIAGTSTNRTKVNAGKEVSVIAANADNFIGVDVAGAVATGSSSSSFAGILSVSYLADDVEAYIKYADVNKGQELSNADSEQKLTVRADNKYNEIIVEGTGSVGKSKSAGATLRTGIIANTVNSYIDNSYVEFRGDSELKNSEEIKQISIAATGSVATGSAGSSLAGVINGIFSFSDQENYITDSYLTTNKLTMDTDKNMLNIGVTGAISVNTNGAAVGESLYIVGIGHNVKTYIEDSDIISVNDVTMTTDFDQNYVGVTFGGGVSTSNGVAASGAYTALVNNGNIDTHISSSSGRKSVKSTKGKVALKSNTNISDVNVVGQVSVSSTKNGVGAAVLTSVNNSDVKSYIEDTNIYAKNGIEIEAKASENHYNIAAGFAGGNGASFEGSVSTLVYSQDVDAYIKNSDIYTDGGISIYSEDKLKTVPVTGAIGVSTAGAGIGGAIFTAVITGETQALAENTDVYTYTDGLTSPIGDFMVKAIQSDDIQGATVAGAASGSSLAASGSVTTIVIDKNVTAEAKDVTNQSSKFSAITVNAEGATKFGQGTGAISGSSSNAFGGAVSTLVINKNINSKITDSNMSTSGALTNKAFADTWISSSLLAGAASSNTALNGAIATQVLNIDTNAKIEGSSLTVLGTTSNTADSTVWNNMNIVSVSASGSTALGGAVYTLVDDTDTTADIINSNIYKTEELQNTANVDSDYIIAMVGGSASGTVAASGAVSTVVLNSTSNANVSGTSSIGQSSDRVGAINNKATNDSNVTVGMGQASGSGEVAVGGTVSTLVSNKKAQAGIDSADIYSDGTITLEAKNIDNIRAITINAGGSGSVAVQGTVNTIVSNNTTDAFVSNSEIDTTVANNVDNTSGLVITASDDTILSGIAGSVSGSGYAAVGASIFTGVIDNDISAYILNSDVKASDSNVLVSAVANETLGSLSNPIVVVAAAGAIAGVSGSVNTLVLSSSADSYISGKKANGITAGKNVSVSTDGKTNSFVTAGTLGVGAAGVGATVNTFVVGKKLTSKIKSGAKIAALNGTTSVKTNSVDAIKSYEVAGAAGGSGVGGVVSTNVIQNKLVSAVEDSATSVNTKDLVLNSKANSTYSDTTGSLGIGGTVGVGLSVQTNVVSSDVQSYIKDANVNSANSISVNADSSQTMDYVVVSGALGGTGSGAGAVSTNVINNNVNAYISGNVSSSGDVKVEAKDSTKFNKVVGGVLSVGASAGVGATIVTNVVSSTVNAYVGGNLTANDLTINASTAQNFDNIYVVGFSGGSVAVSGSVLVNIIDTTVNAYTENGSTITANDIDLTASADTDIDALVGSASAGMVSVGASVEVNSITNTVTANTGNYNTINANSLDVNATSNVDIGYSDNKQVVYAGGAGVVSAAGAVVVNNVNDAVYAFIGGKGDGLVNSSITTDGNINVKASQNTNIYQSIGSATLSGVGIGASIAVNTIKNTVNSYIDNNTNINTDGNLLLDAKSKEVVQGRALAVSGGALALSGGLIYTTIGQTIASANSEDSTTNSNVNKAINQGNTALDKAQDYRNQSQSKYTNNVNNTYSGKGYSLNSKKAEAQSTVQTALNNGLNAKVKSNSASRLASSYTDGTYASTTASDSTSDTDISNILPASYNKIATDTSARKGATSAFIGNNVTIDKKASGVKKVTVNAKNESDVDINIIGGAGGYVGVGIAAGVVNNYTTTEAYVGSGTNIYSLGDINLNSSSDDDINIHSVAATGGIISGSGAVAIANSQKNTKSYINDSTLLSSGAGINILTDAYSLTRALTDAYAIGGGVVGVSLAYAYSQGENTVTLGKDVTLESANDINIKTDSKMNADADSVALTGSLIGGTGASAVAKAGQNARITIGQDLSVDSTGKFAALSKAENIATADTNGRAYGGISVGVTTTTAEVSNKSDNAKTGVLIASSTKAIKAKGFGIGSNMKNTVKGATKAGSGAAISGLDSTVTSSIKSDNSSSIAAATIDSSGGQYAVTSSSSNYFASSNNSSAYGAIASTVGRIYNNINSSVNASSSANIEGSSSIAVTANNIIEKSSTSSNDLVGGAGGIAGKGSAVLIDTIIAATTATLAGQKALSAGNVYTTANTRVFDVEKVDVTGYGALAASDGVAEVNLTLSNIATILNLDIDVDGNAYYSATSDVDIYTKSNVEAYGAMPVADGESNAIIKAINNKVIFGSGSKSTTLLDTFISAVTYADLKASMYAYSKGLLWNVGSSSASAKNQDTNNVVSIDEGAAVNSFGAINVSSLAFHGANANRTAKTVGYALFGIPITITSHSRADAEEDVYSAIELNGSLTSGLGSQRQLTIDNENNSDGYTTSGNIDIAGKIKLGEISSSDVTSICDDLTNQYNSSKSAIQSDIDTYTTQIKRHEETINSNGNALTTAATSANSTLSAAKDYVSELSAADDSCPELDLDTDALSSNYNSYSAILASSESTEATKLEAIKNAHDSASSLATTLSDASTKVDSLKSVANQAKGQAEENQTRAYADMTNYKAQRDTYTEGSSDYNYYNGLYQQASTDYNNYSSEISTLNTTISNYTAQISNLNNLKDKQIELVSNYQTTIAKYSDASVAYRNASASKLSAESAKAGLQNQLTTLTDNYNDQMAYYNSILSTGGDTVSYNLLNIKDVVVRSGETTMNGKVVGNGSISAPGNKFTINVVNNTVNDVQYNTLKIENNLKGGIYGSSIASSVNKTIRYTGPAFYDISIANTVDINDPTVKFDAAGNMLFAGDIINQNGSLNILNWTGNVVTQGSIAVKDLSISVPNGDYMQGYTNSQFATGGTSGGGDIIAGGDINIMAKTINVNGLIQSGSEIKKVTINDFDVVSHNNTYYQSVDNNVYVQMEQAVTDPNYYYIKGTADKGIQYNLVYKNGSYYQLKSDDNWYEMSSSSSGGKTYWSYGTSVTNQSLIDNLNANNSTYSDLNVIKAYYDTTAANGDIKLFKANITGGNITLTGNVVSTGGGKIVLMGGYGKIDVTNNTNYKLVTSKLNADNPVYGVLTIRDFITTPTTDNLNAYYSSVRTEIQNSGWYKNRYGTKKIADMTTPELQDLHNRLSGEDLDIWDYFSNDGNYRDLVHNYLGTYAALYDSALNNDIAANNNIYSYIEKAYKDIKSTEQRDAFNLLLDKISSVYKAWVDENGVLHTDVDNTAYTIRSDGNSHTLSDSRDRVGGSSLTSGNTTTDPNGLRVSSLQYLPDKNDSIYGSGSYKLQTTTRYRSWFDWLFRQWSRPSTNTATTIPIAQSSTPRLAPGDAIKANATSPVNIEFRGYTTPSINVASNSDIEIAGNINVSPGNLNLTSKNGNIYQEQSAYILTGKNINLLSDHNIGSQSTPIQTQLFGGTLTARGYSVPNASNIYINAPSIDENGGYTGFTNVNLKSNNDVVLSTTEGNIGDVSGQVDITGKNVSLKALSGIVNLNKDNSTLIVSDSLNAQAAGDITLVTQGNMKINQIYSTGEGNINLTSLNGDIIAADTNKTFHVNGNNLTISAINGYVGGANQLLTRNTGVFNIAAKNNININNVATDTYIGLISSATGDVSLTSFGAIVDANTAATPYNIKANNLFLNSQYGGIENISINIDGVLDAYAGYVYSTEGNWIIENALADAKISLISKAEPSDNSTPEEVAAYKEGLKDLKVGTILAANNVTLNSEGSIYTNDNSHDNITGNKINLMATNGSVGTASTPLNINSNDSLTIYAGDSVYLTSTNPANALKINEIRGRKNQVKDSSGNLAGYVYDALNKVVIMANNGILNAAADLDTANIVAKVIDIKVNNPSTAATSVGVGLSIKPLNIYTVIDDSLPNNGLTIASNKDVFLTSSVSDLLINQLDVTGNVQIAKVVSYQETIPTTLATNHYTYDNHTAEGDTTTVEEITEENKVVVDKIVTKYNYEKLDNSVKVKKASITGNLLAKADNLTIGEATISNELNTDSNNLAINDVTVNGNSILNVSNLTTVGKANLKTLKLISKDLNVTDKLTVNNLADIKLTDSATIKNIVLVDANSSLNIDTINNLTIDSLTAANNVIINAGETTSISSADVEGSLILNSKNLEVLDTLDVNKIANININETATINKFIANDVLFLNSLNTNITELNAKSNVYLSALDTITITDASIGANLNVTKVQGSDILDGTKNFNVTNSIDVKGSTLIKASNDVTIKNGAFTGKLGIDSKNTAINSLTASSDVDLTAVDTIAFDNASIGGNLKITKTQNGELLAATQNFRVNDTLTVNGTTTVKASKDVNIKNGHFKKDLKIDAENIAINNLDAEDTASLRAKKQTTLTTAEIDGVLTSYSADFDILNKLTVNNEANIYSTDSIYVNDAEITKNLNMESKDIDIREINLLGNMNAKVDSLNLNTSNDLKLGLVQGYSDKYNSLFKLITAKSLLNGNAIANQTNIKSKNLNILAGKGIGNKVNAINVELPSAGGVLDVASGDIINIATTNGPATYSKIKTDSLILNSQNDLRINSMDIKTGDIDTQSYKFDMYNTEIATFATINTPNKYVVVKNTDLEPVIGADLQLYITQHPIHLNLDKTNYISTEAINVTRQNKNILISNIRETNSMDSEANTTIQSLIRQSNNVANSSAVTVFNDQINRNSTLISYINDSTPNQISQIDVIDNFLTNTNNNNSGSSEVIGDSSQPEGTVRNIYQVSDGQASGLGNPAQSGGINELTNRLKDRNNQREFLRTIVNYQNNG